ncbi:ABC transporter permease [Mollicutes bacterium LVI A0039]|nr:ABC transporter permease [Mollicutes bacterium LVI A0039]
MILKLAYNNLKKSFPIYLVYIFTLTLSIALFYGFIALEYSDVITNLSNENKTFSDAFITLVKATSYFVSIFVIFLMVYSSNFFFNVRSREYFMYKTLGMSKRELRKLIFTENIFIGVCSLVLGTLIGMFINQGLCKLLVAYINIDGAKFSIDFSLEALITTAIYFWIILAITSVFSAIKVSKKSLIELKYFQAQVVRKVHTKIISIIVLVLGIVTLLTGFYFSYNSNFDPTSYEFLIASCALLGGTILTYWGIINLLVIRFSKQSHNEKTLQNSLLYNRLQKNKLAIGMISIAFTLIISTLFGTNAMIDYFNTANIIPGDAAIVQYDPDIYNLENINLEAYGLDGHEALYTAYTYRYEEYEFSVVRKSEFDNVMKVIENKEIESSADVVLYDNNSSLSGDFDSPKTQLNKASGLDKLAISSPTNVEVSSNQDVIQLFTSGILVVADSIFPSFQNDNKSLYSEGFDYQFMMFNYRGDQELEENALSLISDVEKREALGNTRMQIINSVMVFQVSMLFITMYISFMLVIIALAILAIQQIMDAIDNQREYNKLRVLGLNVRDIKRIINRNTISYFVFPLVLAITNTIGILICIDKYIYQTIEKTAFSQMLNTEIIFIVVILVIIYTIYIELVKSIYYKIVGV